MPTQLLHEAQLKWTKIYELAMTFIDWFLHGH